MPESINIPADFIARDELVVAPRGALDDWLRRVWLPNAVLDKVAVSERRLLDRVELECASVQLLTDEGLGQAIARIRSDLRRLPQDLGVLAGALALVADTCRRVTGLSPFRSQLLGALLIYRGHVAEMATGEGKTLTVMLAAALRALSGSRVHVITVNDYLATRDFEMARQFLQRLGLSCGLVAAGLPEAQRRAAYQCDVLYCTNKELVFDFLRDRHQNGREPLGLQRHAARLLGGATPQERRYQFAIVDEADSVLLDEAMTPLVLAAGNESPYRDWRVIERVLVLARGLVEGVDFHLDRMARRVELTGVGGQKVCAGLDLREIRLEIDRVKLDLATRALHALYLLERDRAYIVRDGKVQIVDEGTGRVLADRSWEDGLHQLVEVKEGVELSQTRQSVERISFQQFFLLYHTLAGTTGTASEVAGELQEYYRLRVVKVPLNRPGQRRIHPARVFADRNAQSAFIVQRIVELVGLGRPVLVGTRNVAESETLAASLREAGVACKLLNARHLAQEAEIVAQAGEPGCVTVATNMAGRGTDIRLTGAAEKNGGLHVILTELHGAKRIDRQLEGRCARQGDPGSFEIVLRLEPGTELGRLDGWLLLLGRMMPPGRWSENGLGWLASLALWVKRVLQRLSEHRDARLRRRMVRAEQQGRGLIDY